jgi:tRNA dimethylallyltransferase
MVSSHLSPLIIAGPTGSGKSALALKLALRYNGEIICADSRQFYKFMAVGTASPSLQDQSLVPHHGFNFVDPREQKIDAGFFITFAQQHIALIHARQKRPIIVGGTGLYLRALRFGLSDVPRSDPALINKLEQECELLGLANLYKQLQNFDPQSTEKIKISDKYRIIRALAIARQTNKKPSELRQSFTEKDAKISAHWLLKLADKANYEQKLKSRIETMFQEGLLEEAKYLREILSPTHWALDVMGYKEALLYLDNKLTYDQTVQQILIRHRQYAKRQATWFRRESFYKFNIL